MDLIIRNKNVIIELLDDKNIKFKNILIAENVFLKPDTKKIITLAKNKGIKVISTPIYKMPRGRSNNKHEIIVGNISTPPLIDFNNLLINLVQTNQNPFFLFLNRVKNENNIGAIIRTAFAVGVNGIFFQGDISKFLNSETIHISMGTILRIPLVKINIFEAIKLCQKNNIPTYTLQMEGENIFTQNLKGSGAFILGAEDKGVSNTIAKKCDYKISIPMFGQIDSLNVGVSTAIMLYEKIRQEKFEN